MLNTRLHSRSWQRARGVPSLISLLCGARARIGLSVVSKACSCTPLQANRQRAGAHTQQGCHAARCCSRSSCALAASFSSACSAWTPCRCGPCKMIAPVYDQLAQEFPSVKFFKVDIDNQVGSAPTWSAGSAQPEASSPLDGQDCKHGMPQPAGAACAALDPGYWGSADDEATPLLSASAELEPDSDGELGWGPRADGHRLAASQLACGCSLTFQAAANPRIPCCRRCLLCIMQPLMRAALPPRPAWRSRKRYLNSSHTHTHTHLHSRTPPPHPPLRSLPQ